MSTASDLGTVFQDGEVIIRQGQVGDCMYVVQEGSVVVVVEQNGRETQLAVRHEGDYFGEMALFEKEERMATVRAQGTVRVLTVDKKNLMRHIHANPSMVFRLLETMSSRIRELSHEYAQLKGTRGAEENN